jgi:LL-diaminopimelate aminotransferase
MTKLNTHFDKLSDFYLFAHIQQRVNSFKHTHPTATLIDLGIGDVTRPLSPFLHAALLRATQEMGDARAFRGYGPSQGYPFLREAIAAAEYGTVGISPEEIFVSDGAKGALGGVQELFAEENRVLVCDPTYPVYVDTSLLAGRDQILYVPCLEKHCFLPEPPTIPADLIYLCSPNNPTGIALDRAILFRWVEYAHRHSAVIIFDGAYEAFITSSEVPRTIYEIEGAKEVAIEIRSFSKTAGFSGLRCSYTVIPKELQIDGRSLRSMWQRRTDAKFGGVAYPVQRCAAAIYTPEGRKEVREVIASYQGRAQFLRSGLLKLGYTVYGGEDSPYLFCKTPPTLTSWQFFDFLLEHSHIISVPGSGLGVHGEGFVRLSSFAPPPALAEALLRLKL